MGLFLPLAVSVVSGDSVAGEANIGTLRYLLAVRRHPAPAAHGQVRRHHVGAFFATYVVAMVGMVMGLALFGGGSMTLLSGTQISFAAGTAPRAARRVLPRLRAGRPRRRRPVRLDPDRATDRGDHRDDHVQLDVVRARLDPAGGWLHPYLLTHHWLDFGDLFRDPIAWNNIVAGLVLAASYAVVFFAAAWARFTTKDVTS